MNKPEVDIDTRLAPVVDDVKRLNRYMVAVIIVVVASVVAMLLTVGGIITNSLAEKQATYLDLRDQVKDNNTKIDVLIQKLEDGKSDQTTPNSKASE